MFKLLLLTSLALVEPFQHGRNYDGGAGYRLELLLPKQRFHVFAQHLADVKGK